MKKTTLLEQVRCHDGSVMTLNEHDGSIVIRVDGAELMSTRRIASELRLGELAGEGPAVPKAPVVLIGGLGLGFTLRGALSVLPPRAKVVVAELMPEVVAWNRNPAYNLAGKELEDPRTVLEMGDVFDIIAREAKVFDAILLDADNNTTKMTTDGNRRLYRADGIARVRAALRPKGRVVYWSATHDPQLANLLAKCGFTVTVEKIRAAKTTGPTHELIIAAL